MCRSRLAPRNVGEIPCTCGCGCDRDSSFRRFSTREEELESLESYKDQLQRELAGVEQRIKES